jgi:DNA-binding CsgD family transcriptional regulator
MHVMSTGLNRGRLAFDDKRWADATDEFLAADREAALDVDDVERLAVAAYLCGRDTESTDAWARAHTSCLDEGDPVRAASCAMWLALGLLLRGEQAPASGWLARAEHLVEGHPVCAVHGWVLVPMGLQHLDDDPPAAQAVFARVADIGRRCDDADVTTLGTLGTGQALIAMGQEPAGLLLLDEVMVAVTAGELSPIVAGLVYCAVIETCQFAFDVRRAHEWTAALTRWCDSQPGLVLYRGQCLVHRAELLRLHGEWPDALGETRRACQQLAGPPAHPAVAAAWYQQAELLRLRGELAAAEDAFRRASDAGRDPQPGLARLRVDQGRTGAAAAAIRRALEEHTDRFARSQLLGAAAEILLAGGDVESARVVAAELAAMAAGNPVPALRALAAHATGEVQLADGNPSAALAEGRQAWRLWRDLEAPYEAARARVLVGNACRQLGDEEGAALEWDAARRAFHQLGARPDLARLGDATDGQPQHGLSGRELEVLGHVAQGKTNRSIGSDLGISEKTVARHVSNIFAKIGVSSRTAATAYAYENDLVTPT